MAKISLIIHFFAVYYQSTQVYTCQFEQRGVKMDKLTYSIREASEVLGLSRPKMYDLINCDDFPSFRVGGRVLISVEGLKRWVAAQADIHDQPEGGNR